MLRFLVVACVLFASVLPVLGEDAVLLGGDIDHGGYGAFDIGATEALDEVSMVIGGHGAWIINHTFAVGGAGWAMVPEFEKQGLIPFNPDSEVAVTMGAGGLTLEYIWASEKVVHFNIGTMVGWGGIAITEKYNYESDEEWNTDNSVGDAFFVLEPHAGIELNMMHFWRIDFTCSYRYINGIEKFDFEDSDFSGFTGKLQLRFGKF